MTDQIAAYDGARARTGEFFSELPPADPQHTAAAVLDLVEMEQPPLRLLLGAHVRPMVLDTYRQRNATWEQFAGLSDSAQ